MTPQEAIEISILKRRLEFLTTPELRDAPPQKSIEQEYPDVCSHELFLDWMERCLAAFDALWKKQTEHLQ